VIDASDVGDLECLQAISRLYFEELLIDLDHGLDPGKAPRRDTGKHVALVEVDGPTPVSEETSGPVAGEPGAQTIVPRGRPPRRRRIWQRPGRRVQARGRHPERRARRTARRRMPRSWSRRGR